MKTHLILLAVTIITVFAALPVRADRANVGYCEESLATSSSGRITGVSGSNADVSIAICLTKDLLTAYTGCSVETIRWGIPTTASTMPNNTKVWLRKTISGQDLATGTANVKAGWNEIALQTPLTLTEDIDSLWVGVTYNQNSRLTILSFVGETHPLGSFAGTNGQMEDYSSRNWGNLSIEAVVTGDVPTHNIAFQTVASTQYVVQVGQPITIAGNIKNRAATTCKNPQIRYILNGTESGNFTISGTIPYLSSKDFKFEIPTTSITGDTTAEIELELIWSDEAIDDFPSDNLAHITTEMMLNPIPRAMVVEEGTGSWCGFCVRGIVAMKEMREKYPDRFIGIGIHNGDEYVVPNYISWLSDYSGSYPFCIINRTSGVIDPSPENLENYYQTLTVPAFAELTVKGYYDIDTKALTFKADTRFLADIENAEYRLAFVLIEDQLPILQSNYYSGGEYGPMGGFEDMASNVSIKIDHVARGVWPTAHGAPNSIPADILKGENYAYEYRTKMPTVKNLENLAVIALLIDYNTKEIVQAAQSFGVENVSNINAVLSEELPSQAIYDLTGRRVSQKSTGILIMNGKKIIKK